MSSALEPSKINQELQALDSDLALLASEAAIDIDNMLSCRGCEFVAMRQLAERLNNSIKEDLTICSPRSLMDPATLSVLSAAVMEAQNKSLPKVDELLGEAAKIAKILSSSTSAENSDELRQARDFCMAFSKAVVGYRKSMYYLRQPQPFRS